MTAASAEALVQRGRAMASGANLDQCTAGDGEQRFRSPVCDPSLLQASAPRTPDGNTSILDAFAATILMQRYGTPEEAAGLVAFLASDDAGFANGGACTVDGGLTTG